MKWPMNLFENGQRTSIIHCLILFAVSLFMTCAEAAEAPLQSLPQGGDGRGTYLVTTHKSYSKNVRLLSYVPGFEGLKMQMQIVRDRRYLYVAWRTGVRVFDVTEPSNPKQITVINPGGNNIQVANNLLIVANEIPSTQPPDYSGRQGVTIFDVSDPANPKELSYFKVDGSGTHRNFYDGGRYLYLSAGLHGWKGSRPGSARFGNILLIVDVSDPKNPKEAGRWWVKGQAPDEEINWSPKEEPFNYLHGPVYTIGNRGYASWGHAGFILLDMTDPTKPKQMSRLDFSPPFTGGIPVHTAFPLLSRRLVVLVPEAIAFECREQRPYAWIVDIRSESNPIPISTFPVPVPPPDAPYADFCMKGGRFGPHNVQHLKEPGTRRDDVIFLAYFNAGLRIYDISNPFRPSEVGYFIPPNPRRTLRGTEDVFIEWDRGIVHVITDDGLYILESDFARSLPAGIEKPAPGGGH